MDNTLHIVAVWLHILGIALFVGPQFFLAFAWVPASRQIADLPTRVAAMRTITTRFGWIGGIGLVLTIGAGIYLISDWRNYYGYPADAGFTDIRYGVIFIVKMTVLIVMLSAVALHMFVVGPRLLDVYERQAEGERVDDELASAKRASMSLSLLGLLLALAMMVMGVMMNTTSFSFQAT